MAAFVLGTHFSHVLHVFFVKEEEATAIHLSALLPFLNLGNFLLLFWFLLVSGHIEKIREKALIVLPFPFGLLVGGHVEGLTTSTSVVLSVFWFWNLWWLLVGSLWSVCVSGTLLLKSILEGLLHWRKRLLEEAEQACVLVLSFILFPRLITILQTIIVPLRTFLLIYIFSKFEAHLEGFVHLDLELDSLGFIKFSTGSDLYREVVLAVDFVEVRKGLLKVETYPGHLKVLDFLVSVPMLLLLVHVHVHVLN